MGIKGAVNFTRKSNIKKKIQNKPDISIHDQAVLARKMAHSLKTQQGYKTGLNK